MRSYLKRFIVFSLKIIFGTFFVGLTCTLSLFALFVTAGILLKVVSPKEAIADKPKDYIYGNKSAKSEFISIPINGVIVGDASDVGDPVGVFSESMTLGYDVKQELRALSSEKSVKGVILDINSPGGTIYGAKAIADGVAYYKATTHKPVVAFVSGLAASGAYWSAVSTDAIVADSGTSVGSIGVISGPFQYYDTPIAQDGGLLSGGIVTQKGIETTYITAGRSKDFGNPYRRMTKDEIASVQGMVNNEYDSFVSYVSSQRNIPKEHIVNDLGALVYDGKTALENHMIDLIGSREDAYSQLAKKAGLGDNDYGVYQETTKRGLLTSILQSSVLFPGVTKVSFCGLTKIHLAYHGDVSELCNK